MFPIFRLLTEFFRNKAYRALTISAVVILINGMIIYHFVEGWRWLDSLYFSVITLTTVGYGDFSPKTDFGKIFTMIYVLTGIGIIFGFINTFHKHRMLSQRKLNKKLQIMRSTRKIQHEKRKSSL